MMLLASIVLVSQAAGSYVKRKKDIAERAKDIAERAEFALNCRRSARNNDSCKARLNGHRLSKNNRKFYWGHFEKFVDSEANRMKNKIINELPYEFTGYTTDEEEIKMMAENYHSKFQGKIDRKYDVLFGKETPWTSYEEDKQELDKISLDALVLHMFCTMSKAQLRQKITRQDFFFIVKKFKEINENNRNVEDVIKNLPKRFETLAKLLASEKPKGRLVRETAKRKREAEKNAASEELAWKIAAEKANVKLGSLEDDEELFNESGMGKKWADEFC